MAVSSHDQLSPEFQGHDCSKWRQPCRSCRLALDQLLVYLTQKVNGCGGWMRFQFKHIELPHVLGCSWNSSSVGVYYKAKPIFILSCFGSGSENQTPSNQQFPVCSPPAMELLEPHKRVKLSCVLQRLYLIGAPKAARLTYGTYGTCIFKHMLSLIMSDNVWYIA